MQRSGFFSALLLGCALWAGGPHATASAFPWDDRSLSPARRAELVLARMTETEKLALVHGVLGAPWGGRPKPAGALGSAGYLAGNPRLGLPPLQETDGELGVADPGNVRPGDTSVAMPSDLALAATWAPTLARAQGAAVGAEARAKGFSVLLSGAANLIRDPHGGRNFEYFSDDPLLTGIMAGQTVAGVQSRHLVGTVKHFALNDQETDRVVLDARIDPAAARESDLLAFEIAIEQGQPASVMCAYNRVNGIPACANPWLLGDVLKRDWGFPGFVMSDWGAVHATVAAAVAGLDQESGEQLDTDAFFDAPLAQAVATGAVTQARLDDMVRRILGAIFAVGLYDDPPHPQPFDPTDSERIARRIAEAGTVLLKNDGVLPLRADVRRIAVIGAHADKGVLSGGGSSQVVPLGGVAASVPHSGLVPGAFVFDPSSPLDAVRARWPGATVTFDDGRDPARSATLAAASDVALVFANQWMTEAADAPDLDLPDAQNGLIQAVAEANPQTVVVLETGGPVLMPWLDRVGAVLEAWYPGQKGAEALADILNGAVAPSGHLPVSFPRSEAQLPRPKPAGDPAGAPPGPVGHGGHYGRVFKVDYREGAEVGARWYAATRQEPLFPFGFGLSYTQFAVTDLHAAAAGPSLEVGATLCNTGPRAGAAVVQFYAEAPSHDDGPRLIGWQRDDLGAGHCHPVSITADPRLLARFDVQAGRWVRVAGTFVVSAGFDSQHRGRTQQIHLDAASLAP